MVTMHLSSSKSLVPTYFTKVLMSVDLSRLAKSAKGVALVEVASESMEEAYKYIGTIPIMRKRETEARSIA